MSKEYDRYLKSHCDAVNSALNWIINNIESELTERVFPTGVEIKAGMFVQHDASKYSLEEYKAYDDYFYGDGGPNGASPEVEQAFNYAWLHHIHSNPHHWQYWVLIHDDPPKNESEFYDVPGAVSMDIEPLEMPDLYILEMICDWWSFSWRKGDLMEIFNWYDEHRDGIILGDETRRKVEEMLDLMRMKLMEGGE